MTNKQAFIEWVKSVLDDGMEMDESAEKYWAQLQVSRPAKEKPPITENGELVLTFLVNHFEEDTYFKTKEIADSIGVSGRTASGATRKLIADGFIVRGEEEDASYMATDKGIEFIKNRVEE